MKCPGVYALALPKIDLAGQDFDWISDIIYFGMTNCGGGLSARLRKFDDTIRGKEGHSGACRVRFKHRDYRELTSNLFVSTCPVACNVTSSQSDDFLKMGEVAYLEYYCFAKYFGLFQNLPEFNNKKAAPKRTAADLRAATAVLAT